MAVELQNLKEEVIGSGMAYKIGQAYKANLRTQNVDFNKGVMVRLYGIKNANLAGRHEFEVTFCRGHFPLLKTLGVSFDL